MKKKKKAPQAKKAQEPQGKIICGVTIYNIDDLSKLLDMHPITIRRMCNKGQIKARKVGRGWQVTEGNIKAYLEGV